MTSTITERLKCELEESKDSCFYDDASNMSSDAGDCLIEVSKPVITNEMLEEEKRLADKALEEEEKLRKEYEERLQQEEEENKQKRLYHLLSRSQFYTNFLMEKIDSTIQEENKKKEMKNKQEEKQAKTAATRHLKEIKNSHSAAKPKPSKRKREEKKKITDYIDKETIRNVKCTDLEEDADDIFKPKSELEDIGTRITSMGFEVPVAQPLLFEGGVLRPYQMEGLEWMKILYENGVNGILADEMGLGKTIQVIALICYMIEKNVLGPFLIIAPLSTLPNWVMEFEKMAPQIPVVLFHGSKYERPKLYHKLMKRFNVMGKLCAPVVITSYQMPLIEYGPISRLKWRYVIVDEGHVLKNANSQLSRCLRTLKSVNRMLLTGTPLQNNLTELWALLNFLLPDVFDDLNVFATLFHLEDMENSSSNIIDKEKRHNILSTLHQILKPFLLRRLKVDVEINIPPKKELLVYCPMTSIQRDLYSATIDRSIVQMLRPKNSFLEIQLNPDGTKPKRKCTMKRKNYMVNSDSDEDFENPPTKENSDNVIEVEDKTDSSYKVRLVMINIQMQMRKIVNHPYLVNMPITKQKTLKVDEELVNKSGKMLVLDAMLTKLKQNGHKVLIFSYFKIMHDLLEEFLFMRGHKYVRLDGGINLEDRKECIKEFNTNPEIFVFLITTRAGGLGLNLTAADTVIIFDSDWNPQADLQAMDRCHRIGQTKPCVIYRFVTKGTVDETIINVAGRKRKLEKIVIKNGKFKMSKDNKVDLTDLEELRQLLDSTDHEKVIHSNGFVFSDQELEELLDRSDMVPSKANMVPSSNQKKVFEIVCRKNDI